MNGRELRAAAGRARWSVDLGFGLIVVLSLVVGCVDQGGPGAASVPDIELAWDGLGDGREQIRGVHGDRVALDFRLRNSGPGNAYRVTVRASTELGPAQRPLHFMPAPAPGRQVFGVVSFALAEGQSEICLEARLVRRTRAEVAEAKLDNNRVCRPILVRAPLVPNPINASGGGGYD